MAGSRSQTLLRPSRDWSPLTQIGALTVANLITDDTRLAGVQGDGATYPASMAGVWPAATNIVTNGGFETNTTGWAITSAKYNSISASAAASKFGAKSMLASGVGSANNTFQAVTYTYASAPIGTYTASVWCLAKNQTCPATGIRLSNATDGSTGPTATSVGTSTWVRLTVTKTTTAVEDLVLTMWSNYSGTSTGSGGEIDMYFDGVQLETGSIATPYIETDGGAASRSAGSMTMPASVLDETQMWVAARVRHGWGALPYTAPNFWSWGDSDNERLLFYWSSATQIIFNRQTGGVGTGIGLTVSAPALNDDILVVGVAEAARVGGSYNGANLTYTANANIPTLSATSSRIGTQEPIVSGRELGGSFYWVATGKGTLTNADAALFNSWGNNDPLPHMFPRLAQLTFLAPFNGDGTAYRYSA